MNELPWDLKEIIFNYLAAPKNILDEIRQDRQENIILDHTTRGTLYKCIYRHNSRTINSFCVKGGNIFSKNILTHYLLRT